MDVSISHWYGCGYPEVAAALAAEVAGALGVVVRLVPGGGEREFTVRVDGRVVFTRADRGRLPTPDEMLELVAARRA
ncbi:MAG: Rdx family protein [Deltaproteobacteria bacterium]|nr:Rdx family protein [Myxococcales bacterium]MDP3212585.1 Rdx family protein [Deltaproteobacteria bacterium]